MAGGGNRGASSLICKADRRLRNDQPWERETSHLSLARDRSTEIQYLLSCITLVAALIPLRIRASDNWDVSKGAANGDGAGRVKFSHPVKPARSPRRRSPNKVSSRGFAKILTHSKIRVLVYR